MQEAYDKRLNILTHGIKENSDSPWEKHEKSLDKFHDFLKNGLQIEDPDAVEIVDIHRLPQHPVQRFGRNVVRPIIVKLLTMQDKTLIFNSAKHLKAYNSKRISEDATSPHIFITEHLPKKFQEQRKRLLPVFKDAKRRQQKTYWKAVNGNYVLFVNGKKVEASE